MKIIAEIILCRFSNSKAACNGNSETCLLHANVETFLWIAKHVISHSVTLVNKREAPNNSITVVNSITVIYVTTDQSVRERGGGS